jgi:hypothetical protein
VVPAGADAAFGVPSEHGTEGPGLAPTHDSSSSSPSAAEASTTRRRGAPLLAPVRSCRGSSHSRSTARSRALAASASGMERNSHELTWPCDKMHIRPEGRWT